MRRLFVRKVYRYAGCLFVCFILVNNHVACKTGPGDAPVDVVNRSIRSRPVFEATVTHVRFSKPPLVVLTVDVVFRNDESYPRWVVIPSTTPHVPGPPGSGVYAVETLAIGASQGGGVVGQLHGIDDSYVVLLPQGAELKLRDLPIDYWQPPKLTDSVEIAVRAAKEVFIGGQPIREWFEVNPLNEMRVVGDYGSRRLLGRRERQGYKEVPLMLTDETTLALVIPLIPPTMPADMQLQCTKECR